MKRTDQEIKDWRAAMGKLAKEVGDMSDVERERMALSAGTITAEGHPLSPFNCCFLIWQAGKALAQVGGFKQWQRVGRMVRKGSKAIGHIFVPIAGAKAEPEVSEAGDAVEARSLRFRLVPVFDVTQTEVIAAPVAEAVAA